MAEDSGGVLGFALDAKRHVAFCQPLERFFDLRRGLVLRDHALEAVDGGEIIVLGQIETSDIHLGGGQRVPGDAQAVLVLLGKFAVGELADQLGEPFHRFDGVGLVAMRILHLVVVGHGHDMVGKRRVLAAGMDRYEPDAGGNRIVVIASFVIREGSQGERFAGIGFGRIVRERIVAFKVLEFFGRVLEAAVVHQGVTIGEHLVGRIGVFDA